MEVGDVVMGDNMTGPIKLDSHIGCHGWRKYLIFQSGELFPYLALPADQVIVIIAPYKSTVGVIKIARSRIVREYTSTDIFETTALNGEALGADKKLRSSQHSYLGVTERDSFEIGVIRCAYIEKRVISISVKYNLAIAGCYDRNRSLCCAIGG